MSWDFETFFIFTWKIYFLHTVFKIVLLVHDYGNRRQLSLIVIEQGFSHIFRNKFKYVLFCAVGVIWAVASSLSVWMAARTWPTTAPTVTRSLADTTGCNRPRDWCASAEGGACARSYIKNFYSILLILIVKFLHIVVIILEIF